MNLLIDKNKIITDKWHRLPQGSQTITKNNQIIGLQDYLASGKQNVTDFKFGISINSVAEFDQDKDALAKLVSSTQLTLIEIFFELFKSGANYSIARILREQLGWKKRLKASGEIYLDQLPYLLRSGFDVFDLKDIQDEKGLNQALAMIELEKKQSHYLDNFALGIYSV